MRPMGSIRIMIPGSLENLGELEQFVSCQMITPDRRLVPAQIMGSSKYGKKIVIPNSVFPATAAIMLVF